MRLEIRYDTGDGPRVVGHLLEAQRTIYFQYTESFRAQGLELSPFKLPLSLTEPVEDAQRTFEGLHGLFNDSLPDGWGRLVMERPLQARGIDSTLLSPLDRLAFIGTRGMGALTYHPPTDRQGVDALDIDLATVSEHAERILDGSTEDVLPELIRAGGSPMGARPKVVVGVRRDLGHLLSGTDELPTGYSHWLIKFAAKGDPVDVGPIEAAYADMARAAGITFPPTHLFEARNGRRYFGVERFDRDPARPSRRIHVQTFAGLLHLDYRHPVQDYRDLLKATRVLTKNHQNVVEAFRRMVFNILAHNRDDHTKNFAFRMARDGEWGLAPAYDVTFSGGPGGEHSLMIAGEGRVPTRTHAEAVAADASLEGRETRETIAAVEDAVKQWPLFAERNGVSAASTRGIMRTLEETRGGFNDMRRASEAKESARARRNTGRARRRDSQS